MSQPARLLSVLDDREWHSTRELVRRCGHTFGHAKWRLVRRGHPIVRERHPGCRTQFRYRLLHPAEVRAQTALRRRSGCSL